MLIGGRAVTVFFGQKQERLVVFQSNVRLELGQFGHQLLFHLLGRAAMPPLGFVGTPTAIDARRVVESGTAPVINTGIAHREPGIGQIGAGIARAPLGCFVDALREVGRRIGLTAGPPA